VATASASPTNTNLAAGAVYFAMIFALGFALGFLRDIIFRVGAVEASRIIAVLIELPVMLLASWFACAFVIKRFDVSAATVDRAIMGSAAFVLLMAAELCLGVFLLGRSVAEHLRTYSEASYALGLAAQLCFGAFPLIQMRRPSSVASQGGDRSSTPR
jgi:hypothetical protein